MNERTQLQLGSVVRDEHTGLEYEVKSWMGAGASSMTYFVCYQDSIGERHNAIMKECYPIRKNIVRVGKALQWKSETEKKEAIDQFLASYRKMLSIGYKQQMTNSTVVAQNFFLQNETAYMITDYDCGVTYDQLGEKNLGDILEHIIALSKVIQCYHEAGYLHLDIKPSNFICLPETSQMIKVFDFDTVTAMSDLVQKNVKQLYYSEGWAAPEQSRGQACQVGVESDIYAIGAILFWKIMNRMPDCNDRNVFATWDFIGNSIVEGHPSVPRILDNIFRHTLCANPKNRFHGCDELIRALEEALTITHEKTYLLGHILPVSCNFFGRETELEQIHKAFHSGAKNVFVQGFGGIGKSELVKKYVEMYQSEYDTVVMTYYNHGLKELIENQIEIHEEQSFRKKKNEDGNKTTKENPTNTIRNCLKYERVLLVIDNFDVEDDENLEEVLGLNADILFTTRYEHNELLSEKTVQISVDQLPVEQLLQVFMSEYQKPVSEDELELVKEMIGAVDCYTLVVPLMARGIIAAGVSIGEFSKQLSEQGIHVYGDDTEEVKHRKDGITRKDTLFGHLRNVFKLSMLEEKHLLALRNVWMLRQHNKLTKELYKYYTREKNLNLLNDLIERGLVSEVNGELSLHCMIQELIEQDYHPTWSNVPGISSYIKEKFDTLIECVKNQDEGVTGLSYALVMYLDVDDCEEENQFYSVLGYFLVEGIKARGIEYIYDRIFEDEYESIWHINEVDWVEIINNEMGNIAEKCKISIEKCMEEWKKRNYDDEVDYDDLSPEFRLDLERVVQKGDYMKVLLHITELLLYNLDCNRSIHVLDGNAQNFISAKTLIEYIPVYYQLIDLEPSYLKILNQYRNKRKLKYSINKKSYELFVSILKKTIAVCNTLMEYYDDYKEAINKSVEDANRLLKLIYFENGIFFFRHLTIKELVDVSIPSLKEYKRFQRLNWKQKAEIYRDSFLEELDMAEEYEQAYSDAICMTILNKAVASEWIKINLVGLIKSDARMNFAHQNELLCKNASKVMKAFCNTVGVKKQLSKKYRSNKALVDFLAVCLHDVEQILIHCPYGEGDYEWKATAAIHAMTGNKLAPYEKYMNKLIHYQGCEQDLDFMSGWFDKKYFYYMSDIYCDFYVNDYMHRIEMGEIIGDEESWDYAIHVASPIHRYDVYKLVHGRMKQYFEANKDSTDVIAYGHDVVYEAIVDCSFDYAKSLTELALIAICENIAKQRNDYWKESYAIRMFKNLHDIRESPLFYFVMDCYESSYRYGEYTYDGILNILYTMFRHEYVSTTAKLCWRSLKRYIRDGHTHEEIENLFLLTATIMENDIGDERYDFSPYLESDATKKYLVKHGNYTQVEADQLIEEVYKHCPAYCH